MARSSPLTACFIVVALLGASCREMPADAGSARELASSPTSLPAPRAFLEIGPGETSDSRPRAARAELPAPKSLEPWSWALRAEGDSLTVYARPRSGTHVRTTVSARNPWDQPISFPVRSVHLEEDRAWYRVMLGIEPNGSNGWVRGTDVAFERIRHRVVIDLSTRTLRHYRNDELSHRFGVGIGTRENPTTVGRFFVWAHLKPRDPSGPYGSYLLGLSGFSEVLTNWPGGGRMAIHGTADPNDPGNRVSYGCARVFNQQMNELRGIPMGTTVLIRH